jgi:PAS domain S-box-containing protein
MSNQNIQHTMGARPLGWNRIHRNSHSRMHFVQFYDSDAFLVDMLGSWFGDALRGTDSCVFIGTDAHRQDLETRLKADGFDRQGGLERDRLVLVNASAALAEFMVEGRLEHSLFRRLLGEILERVSHGGNVRIFGEMVALLWSRGKRPAAVRLEEIWNEFIRTRSISLCCGHSLNSFSTDTDAFWFSRVCAAHSDVLPAESYSALSTPADRRRLITTLQHQSRILEIERSEREEAEQGRRACQQKLADFIHDAVEGIHRIGPDGTILSANPGQMNLLGYSHDEYVGHHLADFYVERAVYEEFRQRLMKHEVLYDFPSALRCKDGSTTHVLIHATGRWDGDELIYARCFIRDVTDCVELEDQLRAKSNELADADRRKDEFLAMLGHELRNPLAAVLNATVTAQLDGNRRERALMIARRQIDQLAGLVDELLDAARVKRGGIELKRETLRAAELIRETIAQSFGQLREPKLSLVISAKAETALLEADPARLRQIIGNLLHNAVKFTSATGRIAVSADIDGYDLVVRVRDSGIGIAADLLPHIFDLFTQADRSLDRKQGGLGVGLAIVKRLTEMHGGYVRASSAGLGRGSEFEIHLPLVTNAATPTTRSEASPVIAQVARILIVEDNTDAAEALTMLLETFGHQTTVVNDGLAAVDAARDGDFDICLVDIGLPSIDGYEVARRIRTLPHGAAITLVALTGYGQEADKQQALSAGFDKHLTKPVNIDELRALLNSIG